MAFSRCRARAVGLTLITAALWAAYAGAPARAADARKALLLLPVASGTPGQEWSAKALGGLLEDGFGSLGTVRLVSGTAREAALRELAASATVEPEGFLAICRRAGADLAVLGGSTLAEGRLVLELRVFDAGTGKELRSFRGEEPIARAFELVAAAIRHTAAEALPGSGEVRIAQGPAPSLEAYAAYRAALREEAPAARVEQLRAVLKTDANYLDATLRLGVELFRQGSLDEALVVLERAVALGPKMAEARNNYGVALAAAGRPEPAQREFEEAIALAPDYAEARLNLARVFDDRGRSAEAEEQYGALLEADAANDKARFGLAALYDRTGRPELALKEFRLLSARSPDLAEAEFIRAGQEARKAREFGRAEKYFARAADVNPQFAQAWAELGTNSYLAGEYLKGIEHFRKALAIEPGQAAYHYYLGLALEKGRQQEEALREYRRAVELGGPPEARVNLARAALEAGDPGLAVEELNRLLAASPDHAEAKTLLAQATTEMEARRRLLEGQSKFANQRLARLEQIVADANRANRELEARLQAVTRDKQALEEHVQRERGAGPVSAEAGASADTPAEPAPAPGMPPPQAEKAPAREGAARESARPGELERDIERLQGELAAERDARRREAAETQATLALLRAERDRTGQELAEVREGLKREGERLQAEQAAAQAKILELGRGSGEVAELRQRLAGLQADLSRAQTGFGQEREALLQEVSRLKTDIAAEREARRVETERFNAELAASAAARIDLAKQVNEASVLKGRLLAAEGGIAKAEEAQRAEREARRVEAERFKTELAASAAARGELAKQVNEASELKGRLLAAQGGLAKADEAQKAERERGERALAAEREERRAEGEKLRAELAAGQFKRQEKDRLVQDLAAEKALAAAAQAAREKAERALAAEREKAASTQAAERESRQSEVGKLNAALAAAQVSRQDLDRLARELAAEQARARTEQAAREKAEQAQVELRAGSERAIGAERERGERAVAAEREERRGESAQAAARVGTLETQLKAQADALQARESELTAARARERDGAAELARARADLALLSERLASLETRAAAEATRLGERERALESVRLAVRDLGLELGRIALRTQSWEKARVSFEQVVEADPSTGEAWLGLGEAFFQLKQYERSKQMYLKAKEFY